MGSLKIKLQTAKWKIIELEVRYEETTENGDKVLGNIKKLMMIWEYKKVKYNTPCFCTWKRSPSFWGSNAQYGDYS